MTSVERAAQGAESSAYTPPDRSAAAALERVLRDEPTSFAFFQAVRVLGRLRPGRAPVGEWADPADEVVRFVVHPSLAFPPSEIQALTFGDEDRAKPPAERSERQVPARMTVNFLGLTGPQGVLPHVYTEYAAARARTKDTALRDFLDLFHHRVISVLFRVWYVCVLTF